MSDHEIELLKLQLEAREKREARWEKLFMWFVAFIWPTIISIASAYFQQAATATTVDRAKQALAARVDVAVVKADEAAEKASVVEAKTDEIDKAAASTNAITAKWWAKQTGDPLDVAKAVQAQARLEGHAEPAAAPPSP